MSLGDPTLILNYCREYWDGSTCSIAPLSSVDRMEVLNVYERWRLEDFDVVAFCYTPMPASSMLYFNQYDSLGLHGQGPQGHDLSVRTLFFVDPTSVDDLMGKKAESKGSSTDLPKAKDSMEPFGEHKEHDLNAEKMTASIEMKKGKAEDGVFNALHDACVINTASASVPKDKEIDAVMHGSVAESNSCNQLFAEQESICLSEPWDEMVAVLNGADVPAKRKMTHASIKRSASDSHLQGSYAEPEVRSAGWLAANVRSVGMTTPDRSFSPVQSLSLLSPTSLTGAFSGPEDIESNTAPIPSPTSSQASEKDFFASSKGRKTRYKQGYEGGHAFFVIIVKHTYPPCLFCVVEIISPQSEAAAAGSAIGVVFNTLHNYSRIAIADEANQVVTDEVEDLGEPLLGDIEESLPSQSITLVKSMSLASLDQCPKEFTRTRGNSFGCAKDLLPSTERNEQVIRGRDNRSYSMSQQSDKFSVAASFQPSLTTPIEESQDRKHIVSGERKERKALRTRWSTSCSNTVTTTSSAAHHLLKQQRRLALRQLWSLLRQQIFLGMAASSVPVRKDVPNTKEDLDVAGIRFVYFSAQNMKRSKPVAEKLGITFDWNCAISLRHLDSEGGHDPHRHISSYADWDVMGKRATRRLVILLLTLHCLIARMPHGIEAIKEHIQNVDNVPLLVSLFTDATPGTIRSMVEIFRDNGEIVLTIGAGYRAHNQQIYAASNLATSVSYLPNALPFIPAEEKDLFALFPAYSSNCLTRSDLRLSFDLIGLGTMNLLQLRSLDPSLLLSQLLRGKAVLLCLVSCLIRRCELQIPRLEGILP